jgi:hypothetical protein
MTDPRALSFLLLVLGASGCAGGGLGRLDESQELPKEIPVELRDKYEVKDDGLSRAVPQQVVAELKPEKKKPGRKKLKAAPRAAGGGFVYPNRRPEKDPIWLGEKQVFEVTFFGMSAGDVTFEALPYKTINQRKVYHLRGTAISSKVFSLFYRLNDTIETYLDFDGLFSQRFHVLLDEAKQQRDALEINDSEKAQTFYWNRWNHHVNGYTETKEFAPIQPFSQDSMSALYYLRTVPLFTGAVFEFPVVSEGKSWDAVVTVVRREMMDTPLGRVRTVVVKPQTKFQGVLEKKGDSFIWLTDDDRRFVVRLEAKVKIGTVVANLKSVELGTPPE